MSNKFFIYAPNIHQGGGAVLLNALLEAISSENSFVYADTRLKLANQLQSRLQIYRVEPKVSQRLKAEDHLRRSASSGDMVLCLSNLPPLFKSKARVTVFLQNRYLVDKKWWLGLSLYVQLRIFFERMQLKMKHNNAHQFIVQTETMARLLKARLPNIQSIKIIPFYQLSINHAANLNPQYDFIYVASGEAHKNHRRLIEAWCLLAKQNIYPRLCLTLNAIREKNLYEWILQQRQNHKLNIELVDDVPQEKIQGLYRQAKALIYPSLRESFGLPLLEAQQIGLSILAAELDYVRDLVDPQMSFDPHSAISIARAVKRFLQLPETRPQAVDALGFLQQVLGRA